MAIVTAHEELRFPKKPNRKATTNDSDGMGGPPVVKKRPIRGGNAGVARRESRPLCRHSPVIQELALVIGFTSTRDHIR
jgi:hypothetical protein